MRERESGDPKSTHRCDLWIKDKLEDGGFIDWSSCPADWELGREICVAVVPPKIFDDRFRKPGIVGSHSDLRIRIGLEDILEQTIDVRVSLPDLKEADHAEIVSVSFSRNGRELSRDVPLDLLKRPKFFDGLVKELVSE